MSPAEIAWDETTRELDADPAATLALDRAAWERLGATFAQIDDGQGETPGLATATVKTAAGPVPVGVLDYGADETYLLVPGRSAEHVATAESVLDVLEGSGAVCLETDLVDIAVVARIPTLEQRVTTLERILAQALGGDGSGGAGQTVEGAAEALEVERDPLSGEVRQVRRRAKEIDDGAETANAMETARQAGVTDKEMRYIAETWGRRVR